MSIFRDAQCDLFVGDHKYWLMTPPDQVDWDNEEVLNRAPLYRDRRDFVIQDGDSGMRHDYPTNPAEPCRAVVQRGDEYAS